MTMRPSPNTWFPKLDRYNLLALGATLIACLLVLTVTFTNSAKIDQRRIHTDGKRLLRFLQKIPTDNLTLTELLATYLKTLPEDLEQNNVVAYLVLRDPSGKVAAHMAKSGVSVPSRFPDQKPEGNYERTIDGQKNTPRILELSGPIINNGEKSGSIAVGLIEPQFSYFGHDHGIIFTILLTVFMLGIFLVLLFRHQTSTVKKLGLELNTLRVEDLGQLHLRADSALANTLAEGINSLVIKCKDSIREMEKDLTALMTADKVIGYRKARLEAILEQISDGIMVLDHSGMATFANSSVETLLGRDRETIQGRKFHEWLDESATHFLTRYQGYDSRLFRTASLEYQPSHAPDKTVSLTASPLTRQKKDVPSLGTLVVCRDITAHVLAKQASGDFVAHVSHELKSPLNVIRMYSEMLLEEDGLDDALRIEAVNTIHDEVDRLGSLITRLLKISKLELGSISLDRQRIKLPDLLKDSFESVSRNGKESNINFTLNISEQLSPVFVDKDLLRVAFNNLLTNAIKYNRDDGRVTMTAFETADTINIQVEDTGIGIAPEEMTRIFEKFYRSENQETRERSGHGLGLTLAKEIIDLHHGKLQVKSTPGQGTVFTVVFTKDEGLIREGI